MPVIHYINHAITMHICYVRLILQSKFIYSHFQFKSITQMRKISTKSKPFPKFLQLNDGADQLNRRQINV